MKVFVTGGTGFVGSHLVSGLLEAGHQVELLARAGAERKLPSAARNHDGLTVFEGNVLNPATLIGAGRGCEAFIHLVGIIEEDADDGITFQRLHVEATANIVALARNVGAKRLLHMSALGAREMAQSNYHRTKHRSEALVILSGIPFTIFRPSLIFGPGDGYVNVQKKYLHTLWPVIIPGNGKVLLQPVAIENVVEGMVKSLTSEKALNKVYDIGGPKRVSLEQMVDMVAEAKGIRGIRKIHIPIWLMKQVAGIMHAIWPGFPVSRDQLVMLQEDSICEARKFFEEFQITPKEFTVEAIRQYI